MTTLTEGLNRGEYLMSEANGTRSRDAVTVTVAGGVALPSGTVLGKITATGKYIKSLDAAADGSQTAAAVLWEECPAVNGDYARMAHVRDCEVIGVKLNGGVALEGTVVAELKAAGVIVR